MTSKVGPVLARSSKAVVGLAVLGLCAATAAAGTASATPPAPTELVVKIAADAPPPVAGARVGFTALLASGKHPVPGEPVELWVRPVGQSSFTEVAEDTTDTNGTVQVAVALTGNSHAHWVFSGDSQYAASQTTDVFQPVATRVTARVNDRALAIGQRLVVRGRTFPAKPGHMVSLWAGFTPVPLLARPHPKLLAKGVVRADGSYRLSKRFSSVGKRRMFVRVSGGDGNVPGYSPYRRVDVG